MRKFLPYILILSIIVGIFGMGEKVYAVDASTFCNGQVNTDKASLEKCYAAVTACSNSGPIAMDPSGPFRKCVDAYKPTPGQAPATEPTNPYYKACLANSGLVGKTQAECAASNPDTSTYTTCRSTGKTEAECQDASVAAAKTDSGGGGLEKQVPSCLSFDVFKCLISLSYFLFYVIPSSLLALSALFFNAVVALSLSSMVYSASFIGKAWGVVRDLSNIFFILILLYIAVKMILGMGDHGVKKMIAHVVIMALLINFSLFFTQIIIDTSNVLALVFYNKINVTTTDNSDKIDDKNIVKAGSLAYSAFLSPSSTGIVEKDISGGIYSGFDPSKKFGKDFFDKAKVSLPASSLAGFATYTAGGAALGGPVGATIGAAAYGIKVALSANSEVPDGLILTVIIVSGLIMGFAAYSFFMVGIYFLSRMAELFISMIFSPFAFMSFTVPKLSSIEGIGWDEWLARLIQLSFMAPIFLFFMYLIFLIIQTPVFQGYANPDQGTYQTMLLVVMQALVILIILHKATERAKKSAGELGGVVMGAVKGALALGIGGAALGGAALARGTIGSFMKGASTGDTAARRLAAGDPTLGRFGRFSGLIQQKTGIDFAQQKIGAKLNRNQHDVEHAAHARHDLDTAANTVAPGKNWSQLNGEQRSLARRNIARTNAMRDLGYGNKTWGQINDVERAAVNTRLAVPGNADHAVADTLINDARKKQGFGSSLIQSTVTGSYDIRNLANIIAKEQTTGLTKMTAGLIGAIAMSMRGGFKQMGINYGEGKGNFFQDLGSTLTEALKSVKIDVDLSHVGHEKKESGHGGGGGHH